MADQNGGKILTRTERNAMGVNLQTAYETLLTVAKLADICDVCWRPFDGKRCYCEDNQ